MESFRNNLDGLKDIIGDCIFFVAPEDIAFEVFRNTGFGYCAVIYTSNIGSVVPTKVKKIRNLLLAPYYPFGNLLNGLIQEEKHMEKDEEIRVYKFIGNNSITEYCHDKDKINSEYIIDITDNVLKAIEHARKIKELLD